MNSLLRPTLASSALLLASVAFAQGNSGNAPGQNKTNPPATPAAGAPASSGNSGKANPHDPNPNASSAANAIQAVLQKFDGARDKIVNDRKALIDQLAAAKSDTERQSVLAQLKAEEQSVQEQQRTTAKEIRAELQALRRQRTGR